MLGGAGSGVQVHYKHSSQGGRAPGPASMVLLLFHCCRTGRNLASMSPLSLTQGRLTRVLKRITGGWSGYVSSHRICSE